MGEEVPLLCQLHGAGLSQSVSPTGSWDPHNVRGLLHRAGTGDIYWCNGATFQIASIHCSLVRCNCFFTYYPYQFTCHSQFPQVSNLKEADMERLSHGLIICSAEGLILEEQLLLLEYIVYCEKGIILILPFLLQHQVLVYQS